MQGTIETNETEDDKQQQIDQAWQDMLNVYGSLETEIRKN